MLFGPRSFVLDEISGSNDVSFPAVDRTIDPELEGPLEIVVGFVAAAFDDCCVDRLPVPGAPAVVSSPVLVFAAGSDLPSLCCRPASESTVLLSVVLIEGPTSTNAVLTLDRGLSVPFWPTSLQGIYREVTGP